MNEPTTSPIQDPRFLLYEQWNRLMIARAAGQGAWELIKGLQVMLSPFKDGDREYHDAAAKLRKDHANGGKSEAFFWDWAEAAVRLMHRKKLWIEPGKEVKFGEELLQSV